MLESEYSIPKSIQKRKKGLRAGAPSAHTTGRQGRRWQVRKCAWSDKKKKMGECTPPERKKNMKTRGKKKAARFNNCPKKKTGKYQLV